MGQLSKNEACDHCMSIGDGPCVILAAWRAELWLKPYKSFGTYFRSGDSNQVLKFARKLGSRWSMACW